MSRGPSIRSSLSFGALPPLPNHVADQPIRFVSTNDPVNAAIEKMAQSPLKKRLDLGLSASLEKGSSENVEQHDYVELEVMLTSKMKDLENIAPCYDVLNNGERAPKQPRASSRHSSSRPNIPSSPSSSSTSPPPGDASSSSSAMLQQVKEGHLLFKASVREVSLQLGLHCPERSRLVAKTLDFYSALLCKVQPFLEILDKKVKEVEELKNRCEHDDRMKSDIHESINGHWDWGRTMEWKAATIEVIERLKTAERLAVEHSDMYSKAMSEIKMLESSNRDLQQTVAQLHQQLQQVQNQNLDMEAKIRQVTKERDEGLVRMAEEKESVNNMLIEQVEKIKKEGQSQISDLSKQLDNEKKKMAALVCEKAMMESSLTTEKMLSGQRLSSCEAAAAAMLQCLTALNAADVHSCPEVPEISINSKTNTPNLQPLVDNIKSCIGSIVSSKKNAESNEMAGKEKMVLMEDEISVQKEEIQQLKQQIEKLMQQQQANQKAISRTCDASVQAAGCTGNGVEDKGIQTWGLNKDDPEQEAKQEKDHKSLDYQPPPSSSSSSSSSSKSSVEPLSTFMLRYLQKRFGLWEGNAEWEVKRMRQSLGRVLDVIVRCPVDDEFDSPPPPQCRQK